MALQLPTYATIGGEKVVIVSAAEYQRLVRGKTTRADQPTTAELLRDMRLRPCISPANKLLADEEVATFLVEHIGTMQKADLVAAVQERFGAERGPSAGQVYRFEKAVRAQLEESFGL